MGSERPGVGPATLNWKLAYLSMNKTVLIHFSGHNQPRLTAVLTAILASYDACVLDIGQAVVHENFVLGLLVEIPPDNLPSL